jgi:plasmid stabilization system protein ParE
MQINRSENFKNQFRKIVFFIAQDKKSAAKRFKAQVNEAIDDLVNFPFKYRKSIYFDNENIRDMVFKGYTIVYEIKDNSIEIISIFNQNKPIS